MFCMEVCEAGRKLADLGNSRSTKRKYHRGHVVEGQWVFGGIKDDSRKSFIKTVENRTEEMLLNLHQTVIFSDGYIHKTVNHSIEFVNKEGFHTNKIEGYWRQMKAKLPTHGRKKEQYSSY